MVTNNIGSNFDDMVGYIKVLNTRDEIFTKKLK